MRIEVRRYGNVAGIDQVERPPGTNIRGTATNASATASEVRQALLRRSSIIASERRFTASSMTIIMVPESRRR